MPFEFTVTYDGPSVRDGLMDVRELAPALLSTGALVQKANHLLNGDRVQVSVQVRSSFKRGSFIIALLADQSLLDQAKAFLLQHPQIKDVKEILEILFFYGGFFKLINFWGKENLRQFPLRTMEMSKSESGIRAPRSRIMCTTSIWTQMQGRQRG